MHLILWLAGHARAAKDLESDSYQKSYAAFAAATVTKSYPVSSPAELPCFGSTCAGVLRALPLPMSARKKGAMKLPAPAVVECDRCLVKHTSSQVVEGQIQALRVKYGIPADALSEEMIDDMVRSAKPVYAVTVPPSLHASLPGFNATEYEAAFKMVMVTMMLRRTTVQTHASCHRPSCFKASARNGNRCDICRYMFPLEPDLMRHVGAEYLNPYNGECCQRAAAAMRSAGALD